MTLRFTAPAKVYVPVPEMSIGYLGDMVAWTFGDALVGTEFSVPLAPVFRVSMVPAAGPLPSPSRLFRGPRA